MRKVCIKCKQDKSGEEFERNMNNKDGKRGVCTKCVNVRRRQRYRENLDKGRKSSQGWRRRNPKKVFGAELKKRYNITSEDYYALLEQQNKKCAICGNPETTKRKGKVWRLSVDHDHKTGKVRGLLCQNCNKMLGNAGDQISTLLSGAKYLNKPPATVSL